MSERSCVCVCAADMGHIRAGAAPHAKPRVFQYNNSYPLIKCDHAKPIFIVALHMRRALHVAIALLVYVCMCVCERARARRSHHKLAA